MSKRYGIGSTTAQRALAQSFAESGLTQDEFAAQYLVRPARTLRRWMSGESPIPDSVIHRMVQMGMLGEEVAYISARDSQNAKIRRGRLAKSRQNGRHTKAEWSAMCSAYGGQCLRCRATVDVGKDHIRPVYLGGSDLITNIQPLCRRCNSQKTADETDYRIGNPATRMEWLPLNRRSRHRLHLSESIKP